MVLGGEPPGRVGRRRDFSDAPAARVIACGGGVVAPGIPPGRYARTTSRHDRITHDMADERRGGSRPGTTAGEAAWRVGHRTRGTRPARRKASRRRSRPRAGRRQHGARRPAGQGKRARGSGSRGPAWRRRPRPEPARTRRGTPDAQRRRRAAGSVRTRSTGATRRPASAGTAAGAPDARAAERSARAADRRQAHRARPDAAASHGGPSRRRPPAGGASAVRPTCSRRWRRSRAATPTGRSARSWPPPTPSPTTASARRCASCARCASSCPTRRACASSPASRQYRIGNYAAAAKELEAYAELSDSVDQNPVLMDCYRAQRRWRKVEELLVGAGRGVAVGRPRRRGPHRLRRRAGRPGSPARGARPAPQAGRAGEDARRSTTSGSGTPSPTSRSGPATSPGPASCSTRCAAPIPPSPTSPSASPRSDEGVRLPDAAHRDHPWRIHAIAPDFTVEDVWALPVHGDAERLPAARRADGLLGSGQRPVAPDPRARGGSATGSAGRSGSAASPPRPRPAAPSRSPARTRPPWRARLPDDLRGTATGVEFVSLPFTPLYRTDVEFAAELSNPTVHGVMHLGWVDQGDGRPDGRRYQGRMAVLVKPRGRLGEVYMALIKPFRHAIVYPALLRQIERSWDGPARRRARVGGGTARRSMTVVPPS